MPQIALSDLMGSATGAMACVVASVAVALAACPRGARASSLARTSSVYATWRLMVLPSLVAVVHVMAIAASIVASVCSALLGFYRFALAVMFAIAMAFVGVHAATAAVRGAAIRALSRRNAVRLSWRNTAFMDSEVRDFFDR